jgi:hypothetical protein
VIRNGLYSYESKVLDGGDGGYRGVAVLRDGSILGGGSFFYFIGTTVVPTKGEAPQQEHTPAPNTFATAGWNVSAGFSGTYTDKGAEFDATALVGKRSLRYHAVAAAESGLTGPPDKPVRCPTCEEQTLVGCSNGSMVEA